MLSFKQLKVHGPPQATVCGVIFYIGIRTSKMAETRRRKASFFINGFNLYHSILAAEKLMPGEQLKWLDIPSFCHSYIPLFGKDVDLHEIHYFSAYADHLQHEAPEKPSTSQQYNRPSYCYRAIEQRRGGRRV